MAELKLLGGDGEVAAGVKIALRLQTFCARGEDVSADGKIVVLVEQVQ